MSTRRVIGAIVQAVELDRPASPTVLPVDLDRPASPTVLPVDLREAIEAQQGRPVDDETAARLAAMVTDGRSVRDIVAAVDELLAPPRPLTCTRCRQPAHRLVPPGRCPRCSYPAGGNPDDDPDDDQEDHA